MVEILFIIGAMDPEMVRIVRKLTKLGYSFVQGTVNGEICNPSNAYRLDLIETDKKIVFIESSFAEKTINAISCDHPNEGDHGFDLDHTSFVSASSIGQVLKFIIQNDFYHAVETLELQVTDIVSLEEDYFFHNEQWHLSCNGKSVIMNEEVVFIAAFDHCPTYMYQGKCLGVEMKGLKEKRIKAIAENLSINPEEVEAKFKEYDSIVIDKENDILDLTHLELGDNYSLEYLTVRELSLLKCIPIVVRTTTTSKESIIFKIMYLALSANQVISVMNNKTFKNINIKNHFGVPSRGYAGGEIA